MSVLNEALGVLGPAGDSNGRYEPGMAKPRKEQRDLAEAMRQLPGHYADRLLARTLQRIIGTAAARQWEKTVDELITALHARAEAVTAAEHDDLHALLNALNMPVHVSTTWPFSAKSPVILVPARRRMAASPPGIPGQWHRIAWDLNGGDAVPNGSRTRVERSGAEGRRRRSAPHRTAEFPAPTRLRSTASAPLRSAFSVSSCSSRRLRPAAHAAADMLVIRHAHGR
jgi:hypothetical protein